VIDENTVEVAAGTTYTLVCVFADGLIAPNRLYVCGILFYIPDNMKIFGIEDVAVLAEANPELA
jgi:hypothetical protein